VVKTYIQGGPAKVRPTYNFAGTWMCRWNSMVFWQMW